MIGDTSSNTLYFLTAHWKMYDSPVRPRSIGGARPDGSDAMCIDPTGECLDGAIGSFRGGDTIADRLAQAGVRMTGYIEGYDLAVGATAPLDDGGTLTGCAHASPDCPYVGPAAYACVYEPADVPFAYFDTLRDDPTTTPGTRNGFVKDYARLAQDIAAGDLPAVSYVHAYTFRNEHPKFSTITDGVAFVNQTIDLIDDSPQYADNTLVLVTWDESGGFFDHVDPVAHWPVAPDHDDTGAPVLHGPRVPLIAVGHFAATGTVSHVVMDHSSIVKFLEYNFLPAASWLGAADARVNNIGSLLDPTRTGVPIPH